MIATGHPVNTRYLTVARILVILGQELFLLTYTVLLDSEMGTLHIYPPHVPETPDNIRNCSHCAVYRAPRLTGL